MLSTCHIRVPNSAQSQRLRFSISCFPYLYRSHFSHAAHRAQVWGNGVSMTRMEWLSAIAIARCQWGGSCSLKEWENRRHQRIRRFLRLQREGRHTGTALNFEDTYNLSDNSPYHHAKKEQVEGITSTLSNVYTSPATTTATRQGIIIIGCNPLQIYSLVSKEVGLVRCCSRKHSASAARERCAGTLAIPISSVAHISSDSLLEGSTTERYTFVSFTICPIQLAEVLSPGCLSQKTSSPCQSSSKAPTTNTDRHGAVSILHAYALDN
jgi:hypothetical protein